MGDLLRPAGSTRRWRRLRLACLERDGWRCQVPVGAGRCLLPAITAGHITARIDGGADVLENLRAECAPHNYAGGAALANARRGAGGPARPPAQAAPRRPWSW